MNKELFILQQSKVIKECFECTNDYPNHYLTSLNAHSIFNINISSVQVIHKKKLLEYYKLTDILDMQYFRDILACEIARRLNKCKTIDEINSFLMF